MDKKFTKNHNKIYKGIFARKNMNKWIELLIGLVLVVGAIFVAFFSQEWGTWDFWSAAWIVLKGGLFWFVAGMGVLFILLGISDLRE